MKFSLTVGMFFFCFFIIFVFTWLLNNHQGENKAGALFNNTAGNSRGTKMKILFLHHSTGECIWRGGVPEWFERYNNEHGTDFLIEESIFPKSFPYGWNNFPFDYWNIWVNYSSEKPFIKKSTTIKGTLKKWEKKLTFKEIGEPTLEILTRNYDAISLKHCFPMSLIEAGTGMPDIASEVKSIENYMLQYQALKAKMHTFPDTKFIVWTGAVMVENSITGKQAIRMKEFISWLRNEWDESGDNIYLWDFYELETEGGLFLKPKFATSKTDSHPNSVFSEMVAPFFCRRIVEIIEGRGDITKITGKL